MINNILSSQKATPFEAAAEQRKRVLAEKYQNIMDKIDSTIFKTGLLTDYMTETDEVKTNIWQLKLTIDPNFYTEIRDFLKDSFKSMALTLRIDESNMILQKQMTMTIGIDETEPDTAQKITLKKRGWAWDRLNKTALMIRVDNEIKGSKNFYQPRLESA